MARRGVEEVRRELEEVRREGGEESSQHRGTKASQSSACLDSGKSIYELMSWSIYEVLMPLDMIFVKRIVKPKFWGNIFFLGK